MLDELIQVIGTLPPDIQGKLMNLVYKAIYWAEKLQGWPDDWKEPIANIIGHNVIKVLKMANHDTKAYRIAITGYLAKIFDLDDFKPGYPLDPAV